MEPEFRDYIGIDGIDCYGVELMEKNNNILFCWCTVTAAWDDEYNSVLL